MEPGTAYRTRAALDLRVVRRWRYQARPVGDRPKRPNPSELRHLSFDGSLDGLGPGPSEMGQVVSDAYTTSNALRCPRYGFRIGLPAAIEDGEIAQKVLDCLTGPPRLCSLHPGRMGGPLAVRGPVRMALGFRVLQVQRLNSRM